MKPEIISYILNSELPKWILLLIVGVLVEATGRDYLTWLVDILIGVDLDWVEFLVLLEGLRDI